MRAIFQNRAVVAMAVIHIQKFFRITFVQYVTVWLVRIWTNENADKEDHTLSWRRKNVQKRTKNRYGVNPPST